MSHSARGSVGLFWLNAAEGWVDVKKNGQVGTFLDYRYTAGSHEFQ